MKTRNYDKPVMKGKIGSASPAMTSPMSAAKTMSDPTAQATKSSGKQSGGMQMSPSLRHRKGCY